MTSYTSTTPDDLAAMLAAIGVSSVEELFDRQIPEAVRLRRALECRRGCPSRMYTRTCASWGAQRQRRGRALLPGAGMYDHYVPALVDMLMERSEFLTPTPPTSRRSPRGGCR